MAIYPTRIFRRCVEDNKFWWHWRTDCNIWRAAWALKRRGRTFVYITLTNGLRPTTYWLCPGCHALDSRIRTRCHPYLIRRFIRPSGENRCPPIHLPCLPSIPAPPPPPAVPRYYYNNSIVP